MPEVKRKRRRRETPAPAPTLDVSVVIPVARDHGDLESLVESFAAEFKRLGLTWEVVFIEDGVGGTLLELLRDLKSRHAEVQVIRFRQSFGESVALSVGLKRARGELLLTYASYLQIVPSELGKIVSALREGGYDFVSAWRHPRVDAWPNRLQSTFFNWMTRRITGVPFHDLNCALRGMRRRVAGEISFHGDLFRFLPILAHKQGFKTTEIQVRHMAERGKSGFFGFGVYLRRLLDVLALFFLVKFTKKPLRFFGLIGGAFFLMGLAISLWLTVDKVFGSGEALRDRPLLLLGSLLLVLGIQTLSIGLLGEIIIFTHARKLKDYTVDREL
jgi:glycosyltransferase involved in cell wall biosynthesis